MTWQGRTVDTPMVLEEDPKSINGSNQETAFCNGDSLGYWHDFGKKGGYAAIDGHSVVLYNHSTTFSANNLYIDYNGEHQQANFRNALEDWPRPY